MEYKFSLSLWIHKNLIVKHNMSLIKALTAIYNIIVNVRKMFKVLMIQGFGF